MAKTFPGFEHVYYLGGDGSSELTARCELSVSKSVAVTRGELKPGMVTLRWLMGRRNPRDRIIVSTGMSKIVSNRFRQVLQDGSFTGWSAYPVAVFGSRGQVVPAFTGLSIHGRCGPIQEERSLELTRVGPAGGQYTVRRGFYFDESAWDGSDVFLPEGRVATVLVVEPVVVALRRARIRGFDFVRTDQFEL